MGLAGAQSNHATDGLISEGMVARQDSNLRPTDYEDPEDGREK
jgi:hypothetical protein